MSQLRKSVLALALATLTFALPTAPAAAGPMGDRLLSKTDVVLGRDSELYKVALWGGEPATVAVSGDNDSLSLYVYDRNGRLLAEDAGPGDRCCVRFTPARDGEYILKVVNRSRQPVLIAIAVR
jgi:hypothetical protein